MTIPVTATHPYPAQALVNTDAIAHNLQLLGEYSGGTQAMAIVKADGYGHGALNVARAAIAAGVRWLGQAQLTEALALHAALTREGLADQVRLFSWIVAPSVSHPEVGQQLERAVRAGIDLSASHLSEMKAVVEAGRRAGMMPRIHLKIDVGHSRAGFIRSEWKQACEQARHYEEKGHLQVVGVWSHLPCADDDAPEAVEQTLKHIARFDRAVREAEDAGVRPQVRHVAATAAGLWYPQAHYDMIRWGIGMYGYSPNPDRVNPTAGVALSPVMEVRVPLLLVKRISAGETVSYNGTWTAPTDRWVGVVPAGYADGVPRLVSNRARMIVHTCDGPQVVAQVGRICMDQFIVDLGEETVARRGDWVTLFGGDYGEATIPANQWAQWAETINYEITTRLGPRIPRVLCGGGDSTGM